MARPTIDPVLRDVSPFAQCSAHERRLVAPHVTVTTVDAGAVLTEQGEPGQYVMVVVDGTASVQRDGEQIAEVTRGDVVGELSVIVDAPRTATVVARSTMTIATFAPGSFAVVLDECPTIARSVLRTAIERLAPAA